MNDLATSPVPIKIQNALRQVKSEEQLPDVDSAGLDTCYPQVCQPLGLLLLFNIRIGLFIYYLNILNSNPFLTIFYTTGRKPDSVIRG